VGPPLEDAPPELLEPEPPELLGPAPELLELPPPELLPLDDAPPSPSLPESGEPDGLLLLLQALMTPASASEPTLVSKRNRD
jgi:hypothetical protein